MNLTLKNLATSKRRLPRKYGDLSIENVSPDMSFLEMMDVLQRRINC